MSGAPASWWPTSRPRARRRPRYDGVSSAWGRRWPAFFSALTTPRPRSRLSHAARPRIGSSERARRRRGSPPTRSDAFRSWTLRPTGSGPSGSESSRMPSNSRTSCSRWPTRRRSASRRPTIPRQRRRARATRWPSGLARATSRWRIRSRAPRRRHPARKPTRTSTRRMPSRTRAMGWWRMTPTRLGSCRPLRRPARATRADRHLASMRLIDVRHLGRPRVVGCWLVDDVLIDPGPTSCLDTLLAGLEGVVPRSVLLTHIHLDHAGATGSLVERWPELAVYVHERGAPHLIDPSRLLKSARRLYGEDMDELWGEAVPVPEGNIRVLSGGERLLGGAFEVAYTPGHASHHVSYRWGATAFVGDTGGVDR